jgi:hypothetical protein
MFPARFAMSPDGRQIAICRDCVPTGVVEFLVSFDRRAEVAACWQGSEGAEQLFFSPDGQWNRLLRAPLLKKVPALGGAPLLIWRSAGMYGASWAATGEIVRINRQTGTRCDPGQCAERFARSHVPIHAANELKQLWPVLLADGKSIL